MEKSIISLCFLFLAIQVASGQNLPSSPKLKDPTGLPFVKNDLPSSPKLKDPTGHPFVKNTLPSSPKLKDPTGLSFIKNACDQAHRYEPSINTKFCIQSLYSVPASYRANLPGLLKTVASLGSPHLKEAAESASRWLKIANDPKTKESLQACIESFTAAANVMAQLAVTAGTGNYAGVMGSLPGAVQGAFECEEKTRKGPAGPVLIEGLTDAQLYLSIAKVFVRIITEQ